MGFKCTPCSTPNTRKVLSLFKVGEFKSRERFVKFVKQDHREGHTPSYCSHLIFNHNCNSINYFFPLILTQSPV